MTPAAIGALLGVAGWLLFRYDENSRLAPDSLYYQALRRKENVPAPFCGRWFPAALAFHEGMWWLLASASCVLSTAAATQLYGVAGGLLWLGLPAGPRFWARHPVLVDPVGAALLWCLLLASPGDWSMLGFVLMAGATREQLPLILAVLREQPLYLVGYVGTALGYLMLRRPAASYDNAWIRAPWSTTHRARLGQLFDWRLMVLPWGVILPLALLSWEAWTWHTFAVLAIGYLPILRASDTARCYLWASPPLIALAVAAPVPAIVWPVLLLLHWCNPYRGA